MKIKLIQVGKTDEAWLQSGISLYEKRIPHYISFSVITLSSPKYLKTQDLQQILKKEAEIVLASLDNRDHVILLDEKGKEYTSTQLASQIQAFADRPEIQNLIYIIGGPYGFHDDVYKRANTLLSLSKLTFSHQMVRLFFLEQLYRSMTILKGEPYHHL